MRRSSLRSSLLLVAILFSALVVGGMALTTYVVVSDGMSQVAKSSTLDIASGVPDIVHAATDLRAETATGSPAPEDGSESFVGKLERILSVRGLSQAKFSLYGDTGVLIWASAPEARVKGAEVQRALALKTQSVTESTLDAGGIFRGLFGRAALGVFVAHVPIEGPDGSRYVLDVVNTPDSEQAVIDAVRAPMITLALSAMIVMVVMMQTSMSWVLKLVNDLRKAADSIDTGQLDVHLPAEGEHEIGDLARSINGLIDRLRRRAEAQTRFVADASHELATPVAGIRGYTNILRAWGADDPEVRTEAINAIDRESRRMARLCSDLLALVRSERAIEYRKMRFDINARCRQVLAAAATRYIDKGLEFEGPEEGQLFMIGDPDRIEDAISILVDNAAKYTQRGSVSVSTRRRRDTIVVEVEDTGIGIPPEELDSIFDRFYRSDISRSKETGGFGLGLPIARSIVDAAGATIEVVSKPGVGTLFTLRFPKATA